MEAYIGYEYKEIVVDKSRVSFLLDGYKNFGWEADGNISKYYEERKNFQLQNRVVQRIKRNRKINNKTELTRLQKNFESCVKEIEILEKSKTQVATMYTFMTAIVGTAFMAGAIFVVTAQSLHIILCSLLAILGFIGWIFTCFVYKWMVGRRTKKVTPLIEEKYDEIYEICEKGNRLLSYPNEKFRIKIGKS